MNAAGYSDAEAAAIKAEVAHYAAVRDEVKLGAGEDVDFKQYEAGMRHLLDTYIQASASEIVSNFENTGLIELIVQTGRRCDRQAAGRDQEGPRGGRRDDHQQHAQGHHRRARRSTRSTTTRCPTLLDALLEERRKGALDYKAYLAKLLEQAAKLGKGESDTTYPDWADNGARRALDRLLASLIPHMPIQVDTAILTSKPHDWIGNPIKEKKVKRAIRRNLPSDFDRLDELFELVKARHEYQLALTSPSAASTSTSSTRTSRTCTSACTHRSAVSASLHRNVSTTTRSGWRSSSGCRGSRSNASSCRPLSGSPSARWSPASRTTSGAVRHRLKVIERPGRAHIEVDGDRLLLYVAGRNRQRQPARTARPLVPAATSRQPSPT